MRLRRLDLTRFGRFTDFSLDFGAARSEATDFHVIYGPNEAGKTTAFEAYLDLLYGIPARSPYNFLHDYDAMEIGGCLEIDGSPLELRRIKRNRGDLLDATGQAVADTPLTRALAGISRAQYRAMFSLDDDTIEEGGEDILASGGSLGEVLFSAAAGLSDLSAALQDLRAEAQAFHKPRGRQTALAQAKRDLRDLQDQIRDLDLTARRFRQLKADQDVARARVEEARQARSVLQQKAAQVQALLQAIPRLGEHRALAVELEPLHLYRPVPDHWRAEALGLQESEVAARTRLSGAEETLAALSVTNPGAARDPEIMGSRAAIIAHMESPRARAQAAHEDLPKRRLSLSELESRSAALCGDLGLAPDAPPPGTTEIGAAEAAARALQEAEADKTRATRLLAEAQTDVRRAKEALAETPAATGGTLSELLDRLAPDGLSRHLADAQTAQGQAAADLNDALADLVPWSGPADVLPRMPLSADQLARRLAAWAETGTALDQATQRSREAQITLAQAEARAAEAAQVAGLVAEADVEAARTRRDQHWAAHLDTLSADSAARFQREMEHYDALQSARFAAADGLTRMRATQAQVAEARARLDALQGALEAAETRRREVAAGFRTLFAELGLPDSLAPEDLTAWQSKLQVARAARGRAEAAGAEMATAQAAVLNAEAALREALDLPVGDKTALRDHMRMARARALDEAATQAQTRERHKAHQGAQEALQRRQTEVRLAEEAIDTAQRQWQETAAHLPARLRAPAMLVSALPQLRALVQAGLDRAQMQARIASMEADQESFETATRALAERLREPWAQTALATSAALRLRLDRAIEAETQFEAHQAQIETQRQAAAAAKAALAELSAAIAAMAATLPDAERIHSASDVLSALQAADRATDLRSHMTRLETQITTDLGAADFACAVALIEAHEPSAFAAQTDMLSADLKQADAALEDSVGQLSLADQAVQTLGGDDAVARLSERLATARLDLTNQAQRYLSLKIGLAAADQALIRFREIHRSAMLSATAEAFRTLTDGAYHDLMTQADGDRETLLALRSRDGRSVTAGEMSKGTRFQLYLALRLAGYRDYAAKGVALPFLADDIMETFDTVRTSAALRLLQQMGRQGQALYFTHHDHVVDLAQEICGSDVRIHTIGATPV